MIMYLKVSSAKWRPLFPGGGGGGGGDISSQVDIIIIWLFAVYGPAIPVNGVLRW